MTHLEKAIRDAENAGYKPREEKCRHILMHDENGCPFGFHYPPQSETFLDPDFWRCLGEAMGWGTEPASTTATGFPVQEWLMFWHSFITHLASGGNAESYFASISNKN